MKVPELLAPAGSLEKLKVAISYGADAVYLGGVKFGLRSAAENFTRQELKEGVDFAHSHKAKVYVVLNGFLHDSDLDELPDFVSYLDAIGVDATICSDLGVIETVKKFSTIPVHLSTQASCLNKYSAKMYKDLGVERIVLGREVSIAQAAQIKQWSDIEIEMFVHGSMCMAYSGNCVISNFTQGRDSNRGGCAHSCRFEYSIEFESEQQKRKAFFMSSKDLNGIRVLEDFIKAGIDSIKVEGRMKSHLYAGTISKVYSQALSYYKNHGHFLSDDLQRWASELNKVTHREYAQANLIEKAGEDTIFKDREHASNEYVVVGRVLESFEEQATLVEIRNSFNSGATLEFLPFKEDTISLQCSQIYDLKGNQIDRTKPSTIVKLPYIAGVAKDNMVRMPLS